MTAQEFTGERFIPGQGGARIAYEHLHRYLFAASRARGQRVLDVASGAGYGSALVAKAARFVWALELDGPTVVEARGAHADGNILFINGDAAGLPLQDGSIDLVLAFEVIEHLREQEAFVAELARVAAPQGTVVVSTPDKAVYSEARQYANRFHVHEFHREEFVALLQRHFPRVHLMRQQVRAGSLISGPAGSSPVGEIFPGPPPDNGHPAAEPMYLLAVCGSGPSCDAAPGNSAYLDPADILFREWIAEVEASRVEIARLNAEIGKLGCWSRGLQEDVDARDGTIRDLQREAAARDEWLDELREELKSRDGTIVDLQGDMQREIAGRDRVIANLQQEFAERGRWALSLEREVELRDDRLRRTNQALEEAAAHLARIRRAFLYRVLSRLGVLPR